MTILFVYLSVFVLNKTLLLFAVYYNNSYKVIAGALGANTQDCQGLSGEIFNIKTPYNI
jgi:hypothetical protein